MRECWASVLGDCKGPITGEHLISQSLYTSGQVRVRGFPWCRDDFKVIGLSAATANVLCKHHNSGLSELDSAAGVAVQSIRDAFRLDARNRTTLKPWDIPKVQRFVINARRLERWILKTTLNFAHGPGIGAIPRGGAARLEHAEVAFGLKPFAGFAGMYVAAYDGMQLSRAGAIEFVGVAEGDRLVGARMELEGIRFVLNLVSESPVPHLSSIAGMDPDWTAAELKRPFRKILFDHYSFPSHSVDFDWSVA